jgi:hypothetical protein
VLLFIVILVSIVLVLVLLVRGNLLGVDWDLLGHLFMMLETF